MSTPPYDPQASGHHRPVPYVDHTAPAAPYTGYEGPPTHPGQPPAPGPYGYQEPRPASEKKGLAIAALVLGILALLGCWIPFLNIGSAVLGLVGAVLGIVAVVQSSRGTAGGKGMAITGTVLSVVAIVASVLITVATAAFFSSTYDEQLRELEQSLEGAGVDPGALDDLTSGASMGGVVSFDETFTYDDGLAITVSGPEEFTPGEYAVGADGEGTPMIFEISVDNGTDEVFEPSLLFPVVVSAGSESGLVYDDGVDTFASSSIQPGKVLSYTTAFMVADVDDVQLELEPGFMTYETLVVTN
ncbi:hypothetical protein GCM10009718_22190 [Isoptericola halotolerans]|uniref:Uncharacterized membrane protein (UPF0136 family) n=1 Tax=Isoptericola halotolerans TaxID=300560 RepID=A0ABX2A7K2_9MICO|nr:DUF4190 domain-containing protein [Isoptericola halotolerans]NOV98847.1 uncharacterized membrane protein (UPF0136 family) [Isoptericola halotolerans]